MAACPGLLNPRSCLGISVSSPGTAPTPACCSRGGCPGGPCSWPGKGTSGGSSSSEGSSSPSPFRSCLARAWSTSAATYGDGEQGEGPVRGLRGHEEPSLWDPPCQALAALQPVPAPCRVTAAAPAHPGACSGRGHGAQRGRAGLWGMGCRGAGGSDPTGPPALHQALPCSRVMACTSPSGGPRLRTALHSSLGGAGLGWEEQHLPQGPPCPTAGWALSVPSSHHRAPSPSAQPRTMGGSPGQGLTAAQATPGSAGRGTDP